ncbi:TPA: hypothetical protein ACXJRX_000895 [Serratia marcescens]|nr:MAG TPA: hypothetical protein [Caudoviricetes sp.]
MKTIEYRRLHGQRQSDDDGFTYVHGKHKAGRVKRTRNRQSTIRQVRADKRSVKAAEIKRQLAEQVKGDA